ncbi:hypothetical protein ABTF07_19855, partial [Acinetobacter baumannii]
RAQLGDDARQRRQGLGTIAAAVMQQYDILRPLRIVAFHLGDGAVDDLVDARPLPVARIGVQADDGLAILLRDQRGEEFVRRGRLGV